MDQENGGLPAGWAYVTLNDVSKINMGQSPSSEFYNTHKEGLPFFQGKAEFGCFYPTAVKWCTNPIKVAEKDDILISVRAPVGTTNLALEKCCIGRGLSAIRPLLDLPTKYFFYYLRFIESEIEALGTGTTFKSISSNTLRTLSFPFAPIPEQHRIVAEIEKQFSRLDEAVAGLKRIQANLKRYRASVLKAAVEGKLTAEWRKQHPDTEPAEQLLQRILKERRAHWEQAELEKMQAAGKPPKDGQWKLKYKEPVAPDVSDLPELPEGWVWINLEQLAKAIPHALKAGPFGSSLKKSFYVKSGYKIYGQEQVIKNDPYYGDYYIDESHYELLKSCAVQPGDILISLVGTIGKVLVLPKDIEPGIINPRLVKLTLDERLIGVEFLKSYLQSPYVKYLFALASHGGTMDILNLKILKELPIPLPPINEQISIIQEIDRVTTIENSLVKIIQVNLKRAERLRQSILKKAFSGKLVPQDPNDEPASVLLEKIKEGQRA